MRTKHLETRPRHIRLPWLPSERPEAWLHLILGFAAVAAVGQFLVSIAVFAPRAPAFAAQVRQSPGVLVQGGLERRVLSTNHTEQAATGTRPRDGGALHGPAPI
jgi:hypothetical protein